MADAAPPPAPSPAPAASTPAAPSGPASARFAVVADVIRSRRTIKQFTGAPLARAQVDALLELACWAPNHRQSEPWRFAVLDPTAIAALVEVLAGRADLVQRPDPAKGAAKLAALRDRLATVGAMVQVVHRRHADPLIDQEDLAATAAAVQTLLLAATANGLGSFWSTNAMLGHPDVLTWCGLDPLQHGFVGSIWLGHAAPGSPPPASRRPLDERRTWVPARGLA